MQRNDPPPPPALKKKKKTDNAVNSNCVCYNSFDVLFKSKKMLFARDEHQSDFRELT